MKVGSTWVSFDHFEVLQICPHCRAIKLPALLIAARRPEWGEMEAWSAWVHLDWQGVVQVQRSKCVGVLQA